MRHTARFLAPCLTAAALATPPALAQDDAGSGMAAELEKIDFTVEVPEVQADDSSMDTAAIKAVLEGGFTDHAEDLATLDAARITVPTITISYDPPMDGVDDMEGPVTIEYSDLVLENVADGIAKSLTLGGFSMEQDGGAAEFGEVQVANYDFGALFAVYGIIEASETGMRTVFDSFDIAGGTFTGAQGGGCTLGPIHAGAMRARPLERPIEELIALTARADAEEEEMGAPAPETTAELIAFLGDLATAFETSPVTVGELDCAGEDDEGEPVEVAIESFEIGGYANARYPEINVSGIDVTAADGTIAIKNFTLKSIDYAGPLAAIEQAAGEIDDDWFEDNARKMMPVFEGFSLTGADVDAPDPETPGERIKGSLGSLDLTLGAYRNAIPTEISSHARDVTLVVPEAYFEEAAAEIRELGLTEMTLGYELAAAWHPDTNTISLDELSINGKNLGRIAVTAMLGNAGEELFADNPTMAMMAGMGLTVKSAGVDIANEGLLEAIVTLAAAEQNMPPEALRAMVAGMAQGGIISVLQNSDDAQALAAAVHTFLDGGSSLSVDATAIDEAGVGLAELQRLESDPAALAQKVSIESSAE